MGDAIGKCFHLKLNTLSAWMKVIGQLTTRHYGQRYVAELFQSGMSTLPDWQLIAITGTLPPTEYWKEVTAEEFEDAYKVWQLTHEPTVS